MNKNMKTALIIATTATATAVACNYMTDGAVLEAAKAMISKGKDIADEVVVAVE